MEDLQLGYSSVMYDGSAGAYAQNIADTAAGLSCLAIRDRKVEAIRDEVKKKMLLFSSNGRA